MSNAEVGDDVYQEDPTVYRLEELAAKKIGKEAALFVPSGTMGNLIAVLTHCQRGDEVILEMDSHIYILEMDSHIYYYEVGGMSAVAGVIPRLIAGDKGILNPQDVKMALREINLHYPKTTLICVENTHNRAGGTITSPKIIEEICQLAHQRNIQVHIDGARIFNAAVAFGARIFNAAVALNIEPALLAKDVDSMMFCLSKGLSAPVGSILTGSKEFIQRARKNRKMLGGGMRQAGILAAAGIIALENMVERLEEDHKNARILGEGLADIGGIKIDLETIQTNMVYFNLNKSGMNTYQFLPKLAEYNILGLPQPPTKVRLVTHYGINEDDIYATIKAIKEIVS